MGGCAFKSRVYSLPTPEVAWDRLVCSLVGVQEDRDDRLRTLQLDEGGLSAHTFGLWQLVAAVIKTLLGTICPQVVSDTW